ncbi:carbohydrate binding family 9 domain-containing protein [Acidobacteria bacterium AH-259-D05]|nr:carbohydrate binding family 9 domain-containing protein [Acidobacteria bacterium AH-259-D05]
MISGKNRSRKHLPAKSLSKHIRGIGLFLVLFWIACCWPYMLLGARAQDTPTKVARAVRIEGTPKIDGDLSESVWELASVVSEFAQRDPQEGEPATERTEVKILYNHKSIFFGVVCYDSEPEKILARERARDGGATGFHRSDAFMGDDTFEIILDTFHNHQDGFLFRTNPLGTKFDSWISDEGRRENPNWDERWNTAARRTEEGWVAEIEIPFKSIRVPNEEDQPWGIDFKRNIRRKNEEVAWSNYGRDFKFIQVSQAGDLVGLRDISGELRLRVKPYATAGVSRVFVEGEPETDHLFDAGLEDVKYRLTPSLTLDFTANPDFAQVDVDEQVSNLTRFSIFFPEKREFFLENANVFDFGPGGPRPELKLFHSRRVGLSEDREPIDIIAGLRLTGQLKGLDLGFMSVQTDDFQDIPGSNFSVLRVKRKLLSRSVVGAMVTNRQSSLEDDYNRTLGLDANFVFFENLHLESFLAKSETPGLEEDDWAVRPLRVAWDTDFLFASAEHMIIGRNFNAEMGFIPRTDVKQSFLSVEIKPRPRSEMIRQFAFISSLRYITNQQNVLETREQEVFFRTSLESGDSIGFGYARNFEFLDESFRLRGQLLVPPGAYYSDRFSFNVGTHRGRRVGGWFQFQRENGFWGGNRLTMNLSPDLKWSENLSFAFQFRLDDVELPQGEFSSKVSNIRINYNFTNNWLTSTTVQYDSIRDLVNVNFRINWIYRTGDDLFLVFNQARTSSLTDRAIILKFTHSFDF